MPRRGLAPIVERRAKSRGEKSGIVEASEELAGLDRRALDTHNEAHTVAVINEKEKIWEEIMSALSPLNPVVPACNIHAVREFQHSSAPGGDRNARNGEVELG